MRRCYSNLELAVLFEIHCMTCCMDAFRIFLIFSYVRTSALSSGAPTGRATNKNNLKQIKKHKSLESPKKILGGQNLWSLWCSFCVMPPMAQIIVEFKKSHNTSYVACHMNIVNHKSYDVLCQLKITK